MIRKLIESIRMALGPRPTAGIVKEFAAVVEKLNASVVYNERVSDSITQRSLALLNQRHYFDEEATQARRLSAKWSELVS